VNKKEEHISPKFPNSEENIAMATEDRKAGGNGVTAETLS
jgi:hypothetical protein